MRLWCGRVVGPEVVLLGIPWVGKEHPPRGVVPGNPSRKNGRSDHGGERVRLRAEPPSHRTPERGSGWSEALPVKSPIVPDV
ncbi:MAG TPA: hypothetical protein VLK65_18380 [Vicinamibacteria bacterium]|nr:hypothetical protein [Vicinamibacteria bacterium]